MGLFDNVNKAVNEQQKANEAAAAPVKMKVITQESNLNVRSGPGTEHEIVGKAAHGAIVDLISKDDAKWFLIKTDDGIQGYAAASFLQQI